MQITAGITAVVTASVNTSCTARVITVMTKKQRLPHHACWC
jgi:hypothetical protein